ncbi:uncharacterized protein LOC106093912 [Stomoxys calcitrans]|uniref:uncharacterized protein LOC106093912 n=1 Tax=Stomoxys calcitrans TaxID=35570 RepID=UPI0027E30B86|nr:uncharacterized protein LOC106093912 [Stomoxys calcitrans]XP_013116541.2 uncharacterized protein LOC106093912 [Stomoxys calcitrans]XP_059226008.1 uncharacterized protein LOC106093912 [Stomoxys calcitrans]
MGLSSLSRHTAIAALFLVAASIVAIYWVYEDITNKRLHPTDDDDDFTLEYGELVLYMIGILASVLMFLGVSMRRRFLLIPLFFVGLVFVAFKAYMSYRIYRDDINALGFNAFLYGGGTFAVLSPTYGVWREIKAEDAQKHKKYEPTTEVKKLQQ